MLSVFLFLLIFVPAIIAVVFLMAGRRRADQGTVLWTLAIAVEQGLPMIDELEAIAGALSAKRRRWLNQLIAWLADGAPLAESLHRSRGLVPNSAVEAVYVGEQTGRLAESLRDAAVRHTSGQMPSGRGVSTPTLTIAYLLVVPNIAWIIFQGLCYFIIPKYKKIFSDFGVELPEYTQAVLHVADFTVQYWFLAWPLFALMTVAIVGVSIAYCRGWGEWDIPLVGRWFRRLDVPNILRGLALTVETEGRLDETLRTLAESHRRRALRSALGEAASRCATGENCWDALHGAGLLNGHEVAVLQSAGKVGNLPWALRELAKTIEGRLAFRWQAVLEVAQPAVIVAIMVISGMFLAAMFIPLISLIQAIV